ncbi:TonB-dependent receptor [Sphingomonas sp. DBB INV C78]|uniref:TonB-dependent receptor n=1 Tax=Sphingomonas sp. DBB INV C78 TaxID=3349434 RepID=UPI0036D3C5FB
MGADQTRRPVILALGAALAWQTPAFAQEQAPAAEQAATTDSGIQDIIVTARRRNESIQTTPIAVTAIQPSQLEAAAALNIGDLQGAAPNVLITVQATGAATANISIRGIAFADVEKSFDPAVGINVDGVYIGTSTGQFLDFFDIDSIEILRGPQGTLFGRNTISGVINVRRTRPTGELGGKFEASFAKYDQFAARAVVNVPIIKDVLAAKFFEFHTDGSGYYKEVGTGKLRGGSNNENFGASFLLTPSDNFDALLTLEKQIQDFDPVQGPLSQSGDVFCPFLPVCGGNNTTDIYNVFPAPGGYGSYKAPAATLEMNFDAGAVKLTSVTSYRESKEDQLQDFATNGLYNARRRQKYHQFSQELRGAGKIGDSFDYVAGLYYFDSKYRLVQDTLVFGQASTQDTTGKSESYAAFADFNWEIFDRVRLSGGGRWTHDKKENINPLLAPGGVSASESWSKFTPKIGLDYRPTDELMVYASWSRGYRSGGFNGRGQTIGSATTPYDPETVDAYEVGLKSEFWDRRVSLNVAAFYTDYKDIQQSSTVPLTVPPFNETIVTNAAGAKIKGIEADLTVKPADGLILRSSLGYTDSKFEDFIIGQLAGGVLRNFDFSDVDLIYAPKITFAVSGEYTLPVTMGDVDGDIKLNASYRYLSRYDQQIAADANTPLTGPDPIVVERNDPRLRSDEQNLLDASVSFIWDMNASGAKARATVFARNLLDDRGTQTAFTVSAFPILWSFAAAREPRTYGVQLGFEF